jgi:HD-GYP domain-containing protein (c-di-GMP phosphodiesterase class II)/MFS family permease
MLAVGTLSPIARLYVAGTTVIGLAFTLFLLWINRAEVTASSGGVSNLVLALFFTVFALVASQAPLRTSYGIHLSVNLAPLFAAILTLPPGLAALTAMIGTVNQFPGRDYPLYRFLFNRGMFALVYGLGAVLYVSLNGIQPTSIQEPVLDFGIISGALIALLTVAVLNPPFVIIAVALTTGEPIRKIAYQTLQGTLLSYVGLGPLGAMIAYLVSSRKITGIAMASGIFLLLVVYRELSRRSFKLQTVARGSYVAQSRLIDKKDRSTFGHSERVGILAEATASKMHLAADLTEQIRIGATLHDIGKIAIPDAILHKPGKLNDEEWEIMKTHPQEGYEVLHEQEVLEPAAGIVRAHHENYDGTGYPDGLAARAIPIGGRITRIADSYDCITNVRDYRIWVRQPFEALSEIHSMAGSTYDPEVVRAFTQVLIEQNPQLAEQLTGARDKPERVSPLQALRFPPFLKLWIAEGLSNFGDMLTTTGLALAAYQVSRSTLAVGAIFAARALPNLLLGLLAGPLIDRYDRKALMILMDLARAALIGAIPFLLNSNFAIILAIAFLVSTATVLFDPARQAVIPDLLPHRLLQAGNSAMSFAERATEILGYAAAGVIVLSGGLRLVFAIDAFTFAISAALILTIGFPELIHGAQLGYSWRRVRDDVRDGLKQIRDSRTLRVIFPFSFLMVASGSAILPLMVPLAIDHLHAGNAGFAILEASIAIGATIGAVLMGFFQSWRRGQMMVLGALLMGVCTVLAALSGNIATTAVFFVAAGAANMVYLIPMITATQEATGTEIRGRVFAARFTLVQVGILVGIGYAAVVSSQLLPIASVSVALAASGILMVVVSSGAALTPAIRKI